ncbi:uncharacterized protein [Medicago truncatula]|uniref:uncharacterized protein n=1 Tax=Medicago truncatula TaxID=3880 RepID=UPI000D2F3B39|nr:uncharacterized protein LOC112416538 [Medicago truncatula]
MAKMRFRTPWRKWIKECIGTASASVLVNGSPTAEFPLKRGLRQGDSLSPFIFLLAVEGLNVLMKAVVDSQLFTGYCFGALNGLSVSHFQFAEDTLLLGKKNWANVRALRAVLVLFESVSGLKVNFNKSMLSGINISDSWLGAAATVLNCRMGRVPFMYLGLPVGRDASRLSFWDHVVARIAKRLSMWKSRFLSFGGRLILINKEEGGLGVRRMREINLARFGKWCWRMLDDRNGLWYRVLVARYGEEGGVLKDRGRRASSWWRELARGIALAVRFRRLYDLSVDKHCTVEDMHVLGWEEGGEAWQWRRRLWDWEEALVEECRALFANVILHITKSDEWRWRLDNLGKYYVRYVYDLLTSGGNVNVDEVSSLVWHRQVPLKVSILAWRLLRN